MIASETALCLVPAFKHPVLTACAELQVNEPPGKLKYSYFEVFGEAGWIFLLFQVGNDVVVMMTFVMSLLLLIRSCNNTPSSYGQSGKCVTTSGHEPISTLLQVLWLISQAAQGAENLCSVRAGSVRVRGSSSLLLTVLCRVSTALTLQAFSLPGGSSPPIQHHHSATPWMPLPGEPWKSRTFIMEIGS